MNSIPIQRLIKSLIGDLEYNLTYNENGNPNISYSYNTLYYADRKEVIWLNIIDTDAYDESQIYDLAMSVNPAISKMQEQQSGMYIYTILLSKSGLREEVIDEIKNMQKEIISNQKAPRCLSINLDENRVDKLFSRRVSKRDIEQDLVAALKNSMESRYEDTSISQLATAKSEEHRSKYSLGEHKAVVTNILVALNIIIFVLLIGYEYISGIPYNDLLGQFGAKINYNIINGEVWRLISCMFLHANFMHVFINTLSLRNIGVLVETIYGSKRFIIIYFVSGLVGSLASFAFSPVKAVGASGAIFGLIGAMIYFGIEEPEKSKRLFGSSIITMVVVNILYGLTVRGIDNYAHIGGLLGGFAITGLLKSKSYKTNGKSKWYLNRWIYAVMTTVLLVGTIYIGENGQVNTLVRADKILEELEREQNWTELGLEADRIIATDIDEKYKENIYWKAIQANIMQQDYNKAWSYIEDFSKINKSYSEYLAGIIKYNIGELTEARKYLEACVQSDFRVEDCQEILEDISARGY